MYRCAYALPVLAVLAVLERSRYGRRKPGQQRLAWLAGLCFAVDLVAWHHCIAAVGAGLATVLGNVQVVLVPLAAWLVLGERPAGRVIAAVPVVSSGIVLISGVIGSGAYGEDPALGVLFGLLTAVSYAAFLLVLRAGNRDVRRPAGPLFDATVAAGAGALALGWALGELELAPSWPAHGWLVLLALSAQVAGWLLISVTLPRVPVALTSVVLTLQPVAAVVLAALLLDEHPSLAQGAGVAVVIAGIALATARTARWRAAPGRVRVDLT